MRIDSIGRKYPSGLNVARGEADVPTNDARTRENATTEASFFMGKFVSHPTLGISGAHEPPLATSLA